jgi:hypothetical protein
LEIVTGHGLLRAGPVCGWHRDLGNWPSAFVEGLYEALVEDLRLALGAVPEARPGFLS